jgi:catechol 2,3-dioxygenase-like lactoylglutathione lyase family enzyme
VTMKGDGRVVQAAMPVISHILETSLYVADLDRSKEFYERVMAFDVVFHDERMCAMRVPTSGVLLLFKENGSLKPHPTPGGVIPPHGGSGALHLCFAIPLATLDAWVGHLARQNVRIESRVTQYFGGTSLYFHDPDGHSLEVATPGLWPNF